MFKGVYRIWRGLLYRKGIGSSGVGKSTLMNRLLGEGVLETKDIRNDDKGKHTTTHRQLFLLPEGGIIIDTPGMRELGIVSADFDRSFGDIEEIAGRCKFADCSHENEPKCAVKEAISAGLLNAERFKNYKKLQRKLKYNELKTKQLEREKINEMFGSLGAMKKAKKSMKNKNRLGVAILNHPRTLKTNQKYRHYKGKEYLVLHLAKHSETEEDLVVYQALYGEYGIWVRPLDMFLETITVNDKVVNRFEECETTSEIGGTQ